MKAEQDKKKTELEAKKKREKDNQLAREHDDKETEEMVQNLKPEDMEHSVKVVKKYDSADAALNSISERLAEKQLAMQAAQGKSVADVMNSINSKE